MKKTKDKVTDDISFEQALTQLETIVSRLERGEGDLSAALEGYVTGVALLSKCHALLDATEKSVALLMGVDEEGQPKTGPFDASATMGSDPSERPKRR
jgi:exodeoxyribonuclease VII small subunit